jgi:hypothetical protein
MVAIPDDCRALQIEIEVEPPLHEFGWIAFDIGLRIEAATGDGANALRLHKPVVSH